MVEGCLCGKRGPVWQTRGVHGGGGVCVEGGVCVVGGACVAKKGVCVVKGGHAW